jgi:DNA-binding NarL/FixJ family response regulator
MSDFTSSSDIGGRALEPSRPSGVSGPAAVAVFVLDDHPAVVDAIVAVIEATPGLTLAGTASNGAEALALLAELTHLQPQPVLLADVHLHDDSGVTVGRSYIEQLGGSVVLTSARSRESLPADWRSSGASTFLPKHDISSEALLEHARRAADR